VDDRIDRILGKLRTYWLAHPEEALGLLVSNLAGGTRQYAPPARYCDDGSMEKALDHFNSKGDALNFKVGQRVMVDGRLGTVMSQRMAPPDFFQAATVSLMMDDQKATMTYYAGSTFPAEKVHLVVE
jgi:hypothetical protein